MTGLSVVMRANRAAGSVGLVALVLFAGGCLTPVDEKENVVAEISPDHCSPQALSRVGALDVAIAIDNSLSTGNPSGADIDGDGVVGRIRASRDTDRDDSRLSAEIRAVQQLVALAEATDVRFSIVSYSGPSSVPGNPQPARIVWKRDARIHADLTQDVARLLRGIDEVRQHGSKGTSNFVAGLRKATRTLVEGKDRARPSRQLVLFISDSAAPVLREPGRKDTREDTRLEHVARQAIDHRIVINTFGLSRESDDWRLEPLGLVAGATGGDYHVVTDPRTLYCHLAGSLVTASAVQ